MRNQQQPEKKREHDGSSLQVNSIFHTLQGEGPYAGHPAVFVRLAGCNLQCPNCDTEYSEREEFGLQRIHSEMLEVRGHSATRLAVITGGEPFRQNLLPFVTMLLRNNWSVQIETNGTLYQELPYHQITVVCSPKTGSINKLLLQHLSALKYVVEAKALGTDGFPDIALGHGVTRLPRPPRGFRGRVYLQPYDSGDAEENLEHQEETIKACYKTGSIYCHQLHKVLGLE